MNVNLIYKFAIEKFYKFNLLMLCCCIIYLLYLYRKCKQLESSIISTISNSSYGYQEVDKYQVLRFNTSTIERECCYILV